MQTMTDLSTFQLEASEHKSIPSATGLIKQFDRATEQLDWSLRPLQIEKLANRVCLIIITLSALYFTPIVISIIYR